MNGKSNIAGRAFRRRPRQPGPWPRRQKPSVHVAGPPAHGPAGHDVLAHRLFEKAFRGDEADLARTDVRFVDQSANAAEVKELALAPQAGVDGRRRRDALIHEGRTVQRESRTALSVEDRRCGQLGDVAAPDEFEILQVRKRQFLADAMAGGPGGGEAPSSLCFAPPSVVVSPPANRCPVSIMRENHDAPNGREHCEKRA